jgi:hypothetical protein
MTVQIKTPAPVATPGTSASTTEVASLLSPTLTLLQKQIISFSTQLKSCACYLNPDKVYIAIDGEWVTYEAWAQGFANWLQSTAVVIYCANGDWQFHTFLFNSLRIPESSRLQIECEFASVSDFTIVNQQLPNNAPIIESWLEANADSFKTIEVIGKYSALDYHAFFGEEVWLEEMVNGGLVTQKRCLRFNVPSNRRDRRAYKPVTLANSYCLRDLQGLNSGSLKTQAESVGRELYAKSLVTRYLGQMDKAYDDCPLEATVYNICDSFAAMQITIDYVPLVNLIIESLGLPVRGDRSYAITLDELPHTTGSLVGRVFCNFIEYYPYIAAKREGWQLDALQLALLYQKWRLALWRNARKSDSANSYFSNLANKVLQGQQECSTVEQYMAYEVVVGKTKGGDEKHKSLYEITMDTGMMQQMFGGSLYEQACAKAFGSNVDSTSVFAALVQGGRCNNSNPFSTFIKGVLDVDMSSCYGSTLRKLTLPIGLPSVYSRSNAHGEKLETFDKVHSRLKSELVDDLWFADVSTSSNLRFDQDLLFSSFHVTPEIIRNAVTGASSHYDEEVGENVETTGDVKKIPNSFVLSRRQLDHARICASSQRVLEAVASDKEKGDLRTKLVCNTLVYYPRSQQAVDMEAFVDHILADKGAVTTDGKNNVVDARSRVWYGVKLEYFTGVLVDQRGVIKGQMKAAKKAGDKALAKALHGKQDMFKLFVNTLYGDLASVYFSFGNTVLANVITDKARVGAWQMSKALRTVMEITDGGMYEALAVAFNRGDTKPGLEVLSDWRKWKQTNRARKINRTLEPLGGLAEEIWQKWFVLYHQYTIDKRNAETIDDKAGVEAASSCMKHMETQIDSLADYHIRLFWQQYGLSFEFGIEHKYEHTSWSAGYISKSDYCLQVVGGGEPVIKKRGSRPARDDNDSCTASEYRDPGFDLLQALASGDTSKYVHRGFTSSRIAKVGEYVEAKVSNKPLTKVPETLAELKQAQLVVPGWEIVTKRKPRQINNGHIYIRDLAMYESIQKRRGVEKNQPLLWFERYVTDVEKLTQTMNDNCLNKSKANNSRK